MTQAAPGLRDYDARRPTLGSVLARQAATRPDKFFLVSVGDGRRFTYAETEALANRYAHGLLAAGIGRGQHVALMLENSPEYLFLLFALAKIGAVAVPVNIAARGELFAYYLRLVDAAALVVDRRWVDRVEAVREHLPKLQRVVVMPVAGDPGDLPALGSLAVLPFGALLGTDASPPDIEVRFDDTCLLAFTSGTTGPSKASIYPHVKMVLAAQSIAQGWGYREDDVYYVCLPLFHMNAVFASTYVALELGATVALSPRFSASGFWNEVRACGATTFNLLGSMLNILWAQPPSSADRAHRVRMCRSAPMPSFAADFEARFGLRLVTTYGLSDYGVPVAWTLDDPVTTRGAAGRPLPGWEVRIVDEDDFDVPAGSMGEIVLRSSTPWMTSGGYYGMPEATIAAHRNGWFHTGDLGHLDAGGYLYFAGRKKDAIRRRGENISAWEVEQVLNAHPAIAEAAVYPLPSDMSEDEVATSIVLKPGAALDPAALVHYCAERMAYFMVPRFIAFVADLPRTSTQKVEKSRLREAALAHPDALFDRERTGIRLAR